MIMMTLFRFAATAPTTTAATTTSTKLLPLGGWDSWLVRALNSQLNGCVFESWQERQENFLSQSQLCVLTLFGVRSTLVLLQWHVKTPVILPKVQVAGYA